MAAVQQTDAVSEMICLFSKRSEELRKCWIRDWGSEHIRRHEEIYDI